MERKKNKQKGTGLAQLIKSFTGVRGVVFQKNPMVAEGFLLIVVLFFMTFFLQAADKYELLSWEGDVRVRRTGKFLKLKAGELFELRGDDGLWIFEGGMAKIRFPGGKTRQIRESGYKLVENLSRLTTRESPSLLSIITKKQGLLDIFRRAIERSVGGTRANGETVAKNFYERIKSALPKIKGETLTPEKQEELNAALAAIDVEFAGVSEAERVVLQAGVYADFGYRQQALETAFNYYETIYDKKKKLYQQLLIEQFVFAHVLPVEITYKVDKQSYVFSRDFDNGPQVTIRFDSNFPVWWASFSFDETQNELKEIEKTIDTKTKPQETYSLKNRPMGKEKESSNQLFIIASSEPFELEKYDDLDIVKKEMLESKLPETVTNTARGFNNVFIKIDLNNVRRDLEKKMKQEEQIMRFVACLLIGICNL